MAYLTIQYSHFADKCDFLCMLFILKKLFKANLVGHHLGDVTYKLPLASFEFSIKKKIA